MLTYLDMKVKCQLCDKWFKTLMCYIKRGGGKFCSTKCYSNSRIGYKPSKETRELLSKLHKGTKNPFYGKKHTKLAKEKMCKKRVGRTPAFKTGRKTNAAGYIFIYSPKHPFAVNNYVCEHRLVMEKKLKRFLKQEEVVHHKNGDVSNNSLSNLQLFSNQSEHIKFHSSKRVRDKKGLFVKD
ncbi:MAG: NUMOD3 domain-containing DNA-binding protein [Candidatus Omnitrophota bacterium]